MGKFKTGQPKPPFSGRKKGQPNEKTLILKSVVDDLGLDVPRRLAELLPTLGPEKQADVLLSLMDYIYPKRKAVEHSGPSGGPIQIQPTRETVKQVLSDPVALAAFEALEATLESKSDHES